MRFNKVLLVQARYNSTFSNVLPAGIGYLSEFLTSRGVSNDVFDLNVIKNTEYRLHDKVSSSKSDIVGFSILGLNYKYNYDMMRNLKKKFPEIKIVAGGAHVSTMREDILKDCEAVDYAVTLEGEDTLLELINDIPLAEIKGLIYRDGQKIVYNGDRPFIQDLDSLPSPKYDKFNKAEYSTLVSIFTSRGCPFECTYCPVQLVIGRRFIARSPRRVVDDMEFHYNRGYREFSFRDDNFTLVPERVDEICDEIERRRFKDLYLMCDNGVRADKIDYRLLKRMKDVGFKMIGLGVESGDDKILKSLKKSATVKIMEDAIKTACDLGYIVELYLLIGAPGETWEDFEKTVNLATKYPIMVASFYHILPYPGTELFEIAKKNNYLLRTPEEYLNDGSQRVNTPFISTPEFPYEIRKKAFDYAYKTTSEYIKKTKTEYSKRNAYEKFKSMGMNDVFALPFANIYSNNFMHDYVFNNSIFSSLRKVIKKRSVLKRCEVGSCHEPR